jgi:flagellar M-ring protein FliF
VLLGMVRPGIKLMKAPPPVQKRDDAQPQQGQLSAVLNDTPERPGLPMPSTAAPSNELATPEVLRLADAKRLAKDNPMAVANIVKGWVNGEVPA